MNEGLKPCPFCGGNRANVQHVILDDCKTFWRVCHACETDFEEAHLHFGKMPYISIKTPWFDSREKAIEAWNTRAERTCHALPPTVNRICTVTDISTGISRQFGYWRCSECGMNNFDGAFRCMRCGAKLEESGVLYE